MDPSVSQMGPSNSMGNRSHGLKTTATVASLPPEVLLETFRILATNAEERWIRYLMYGPFPYDPTSTQQEAVTPAEDFHPFARFAEPKKTDQNTHPSPYVWIRLTHVCRSWRDMALSTSALWTHAALLREEATIEILRRSGEQMLTVTMSMMLSDCDVLRLKLLHLLFTQYMNRIAFAVVPAIPSLFTASHAENALQLRSLTFVAPTFRLGNTNPVSDGTIVPFKFPVLHRIQITVEPCDSFTHLFSRSLTTLILRCSPYFSLTSDDPVITLHKLAHALIHLPFLETLHADLDYNQEDIQMTVALPMLRELRSQGPAGSLKDLLCVLDIPRSTRIQLNCVYDDHRNDTGTPISTALEVTARAIDNVSQVKSSKFEPIVSLAIRNHWSLFHLRGWRSTQILQEERDDSPPDVVLEIPDRIFSEVDVFEFLVDTVFPLGNTQVLRIGRMPFNQGPGVMRAVLGLATLPSLRSLTIQHVEPDIFFNIVRDTTSSQVSLVDVIFDEADDTDIVRSSDTIEDHADPMSTLTAQRFINVCAGRDRQLESLSLKRTGNFSAKDLSMLQDVVQEVSWDSYVGSPEWW